MRPIASEPLGFQDLQEDEALLVWLYRQWRFRGPTHAIVEHRLATLLRRDRVYVHLDRLFELFRTIAPAELPPDGLRDSPLLAPEDEELIDTLAHLGPTGLSAAAPGFCRRKLREDGIVLRPSAAIPRSGRDRLELTIARSYAALSHLSPHPFSGQ